MPVRDWAVNQISVMQAETSSVIDRCDTVESRIAEIKRELEYLMIKHNLLEYQMKQAMPHKYETEFVEHTVSVEVSEKEFKDNLNNLLFGET